MGVLKYIADKLYSNGKEVALVDNQLGNNQTWQNVTAGRTVGAQGSPVSYTNDTGKPIQVMFSGYTIGAQYSINMVVNGTTLGNHDTPDKVWGNISFVVPIGATYSITLTSTTGASSKIWMELR